MGFDNECIVDIQSLAGEYFCPICRLLIYPNEALQSQCTHLYCKPCLTYVVSTTRACPYDGYLVTEADSKPLTESNKTLAETIGKIAVHCLYHRSGCTWQGTLSECTSHCSGCAFGNSPVVCNRCGIQIVHHQVQEHAQNCSGVQAQVQQAAATQDPSASSAAASTDQNQTATQVGAMASQALTSQTVVATTTPQVSNQLANPASQTQPLGQTVVQPTAEQWYQQQQYQQHYQQYTRQDPYQQQYQHYYPYQQSAVPQYQQANGQAQHQSQPQPQPQGQSQPLSHIQAPVALQSQSQKQVNQQKQQLQPAVLPHSQIQSLTHPPGYDQALPQSQPQPQPYPQVQPHSVQPQLQHHIPMPPYQQPHPQMQHSQPQVQQPVQKYPVPQPQVHSQLQHHASVQHLSQPQAHSHEPSQPLIPNIQPQMQNTSSRAVTGHHSYPQPQSHQNMQLGAPQHTMHMHLQTGPQPQSQHPVQVQNHFPQQTPMMFSHQSHAMLPNQQQPAYAHNQQPGQINQRPVLQPVQQLLPQQPFTQPQMLPVPSHLRPQGPAHSFPKNTLAYPQSQGNVTLSDSTQHSQSQNAVGRPLIPNHAVQIQPFAQFDSTIPVRTRHSGASHLPGHQNFLVGTNNQVQLSSELQSRVPEPIGSQGDVIDQQTDSVSGKLGKSLKDLDTVSGSATEMKSGKVETDMKQIEVWNKQNGEDPLSVKTLGSNANALENDGSVNKNLIKGEAAESTWQPLSGKKSGGTISGIQNDSINEHSVVKGKEIQDEPLLNSSLTLEIETKFIESQTDKLRKDDTCPPKPPTGAVNASPAVSEPHGTQGPGIDEYRGMQSGDFAQTSHPASFADQGKHQQPMINYGPAAVQQRPSAMSASQLPHPAVPNQPLYARGSFQPQSFGPPGSYNQVHEPPFNAGASNLSRIEGPQFRAPPPGDMHDGMTANLLPHAPEGQRRLQRPTNLMAAETDPHQRPSYLNGPQCFGLQNERFKSFQVPGQQNIDPREFEDDLKKFPRLPLDAEPISKFGSYSLGPDDSCGSGAKLNPGTSSAASRLHPLPHLPNEAGERPVGFHDDAIKKSGSTLHPGYLGLGPVYGPHHVDGMTPRSPVGEYAEMSSWRFGVLSGGLRTKSGIDEFDGRDAHRFGDTVGIAFQDSRFPHLPRHLHRDEYEGPGNLRMGEHPRSVDLIGQDGYAGHFRRGEHLDPHNFPRHLQLEEPLELGAHLGHMRAVELSGARNFESFSKGNRPGHLRLGEPGFRSSFSLSGVPNDAGILTGDIRLFDNLRRRNVASTGWCRICKVDCETVEGLDLHAQTREHQSMAMDMVQSIKQNVKRQKLTSSEKFSVKGGNKSRKTDFKRRGNKH